MHIAYISSEMVPFSKTGGLADVAGALPSALADLGHEVTCFTPYYRSAKCVDPKARKVAGGALPVGSEMLPWVLYQSGLVKGGVSTYMVGNEHFFDRDGIYGSAKGDFADNCSRYIFFSRAVLAAAQALQKPVDVYHANDWQSALVPVFLKLSFSSHPFHGGAAHLFTIHNLSYQGLFWHWDWPLLNLPWKHFSWKELEFYGKINLLKGALVYADVLNTVSPTYATEIQTPECGAGLEGVLAERRADLFGVVNGIDTRAWNPASDPMLPATYPADNLAGKADCARALRKRFGLPEMDRAPLVGFVGRLVEQKGFDLLSQTLDEFARGPAQWVFLGTGEEKYQQMLLRMREVFPEKIGVALAYDNALAHLVYAGSDLFLMPSKFEPCGLGQLYALRYGTIPVVRKTGGLADTVVDATPEALAGRQATGFTFDEYSAKGLREALARALRTYHEDTQGWLAMQLTGMRQDWSWTHSAKAYVELYEKARAKQARRAG